MVTFDICKGNPGALAFVMEAYERDMFTAEQCFQRMERAGITGDKLYMLWNDCCGRDVGLALETMMCMPTPEIVRHINYEQGRGASHNEKLTGGGGRAGDRRGLTACAGPMPGGAPGKNEVAGGRQWAGISVVS